MKLLSALLVGTLFLGACATSKNTAELEEQVTYYKREALTADSVRVEYRNLQEEKRQTEAELNRALTEMEQLRATNISLNRAYQEILDKYTKVVNENQQALTVSSYENLSLQERLANQQQDLDEKERALAVMEYDLKEKERRLNVMEYNYTETKGALGEKEQKIREMEAMLAQQEAKMANLRKNVSEVFQGFSVEDLTVTERNGKMYVSMSQNLLFSSGSDEVDWKGKRALVQLAEALKKNPDIQIMVEGHTDTDGTAARNWDLSVLRATSVVKNLVAYGVQPGRIQASGRGFYAPIASNDTPQGKALNRRTEIILSPKLDDLYQIIKE